MLQFNFTFAHASVVAKQAALQSTGLAAVFFTHLHVSGF
jgi:hypothetical protein